MSCLFDALGKSVNMNGSELRRVLCDYIATNPRLLDDLTAEQVISFTENIPLGRYLTRMRHPNAWGGCIEIKAFCELFHKAVVVAVTYTRKYFEVIPQSGIHNYVIITYNGSHFEFVKNH